MGNASLAPKKIPESSLPSYRKMVKDSQEAILILNSKLKIKNVNKQLLQLFKYSSKKSLKKTSLNDLLSQNQPHLKKDRKMIFQQMKEETLEEQGDYVVLLQNKKSEDFWGHVYITSLQLGDDGAVQIIIQQTENPMLSGFDNETETGTETGTETLTEREIVSEIEGNYYKKKRNQKKQNSNFSDQEEKTNSHSSKTKKRWFFKRSKRKSTGSKKKNKKMKSSSSLQGNSQNRRKTVDETQKGRSVSNDRNKPNRKKTYNTNLSATSFHKPRILNQGRKASPVTSYSSPEPMNLTVPKRIGGSNLSTSTNTNKLTSKKASNITFGDTETEELITVQVDLIKSEVRSCSNIETERLVVKTLNEIYVHFSETISQKDESIFLLSERLFLEKEDFRERYAKLEKMLQTKLNLLESIKRNKNALIDQNTQYRKQLSDINSVFSHQNNIFLEMSQLLKTENEENID
ncbi:hypothetical protein M0812_27779 [Anaeramoeba flamelloides]|uniref:PAS domain-containing protein n=1 Tax=Anaeramoeba flamelloides TaxID=1746091 RepID=A0AAV7Y679_9EUKA|nr:hypothetical protein M0812_27779 [Anaeramoeba flamelloides]